MIAELLSTGLLTSLLNAYIKEVNVKAIDLTLANSIVEKVENNQEQQVASKISKPRKRRNTGVIFGPEENNAKIKEPRKRRNTGAIFSPEEDSAEIKKPRARRHTWTFS